MGLTKFQDNKLIFLLCDCHSEVLVIEYDSQIKCAELAMYENHASYKHKLSIWQRIRYCYQVLINKKPYTDQIMLNNKQIQELKTFLNSLPVK
jgi:hypothetical protein